VIAGWVSEPTRALGCRARLQPVGQPGSAAGGGVYPGVGVGTEVKHSSEPLPRVTAMRAYVFHGTVTLASIRPWCLPGRYLTEQ
jgi:hypothetical protein